MICGKTPKNKKTENIKHLKKSLKIGINCYQSPRLTMPGGTPHKIQLCKMISGVCKINCNTIYKKTKNSKTHSKSKFEARAL